MKNEKPDFEKFTLSILYERLIYLKYCIFKGYEINPDEINELELEVYPWLSKPSNDEENTLGLRELDELRLLLLLADPPNNNSDSSIKARIIQLQNTILRMRAEKNHQRPHFHIEYKQQYSASYAIERIEILEGYMPDRYDKNILYWASKHQELLHRIWDNLNFGKDFTDLLIEAHQSI